MIPLIETQPRLVNFSTEKDFAYAMRRWSEKVKALRIELDRVPEAIRFDDFENWWDRLSDIVGILEGRSEVLMRVCEDLGADWKEVCVAWTVFVDARSRRHDLLYANSFIIKRSMFDSLFAVIFFRKSALNCHLIQRIWRI